MQMRLAGGKRVVAEFKGFQIMTDQPVKSGGEGSAPAPFDLFLASMGTCAAYYVLDFCDARGIASEGISVVQSWESDPVTHLVTSIRQELLLPEGFPAKYEQAIVRAASLCAVKKHLEHPPQIEIRVTRAAARAPQG